MHNPANELRPRRLGSALDEDQNSANEGGQVIVNKTFDIKLSDTMNISVDTLDCSPRNQLMQTPTLVLNKTTVIGQATQPRALACIREEGSSPPKVETLSPPPKSKVHDLKRDVNLIGSPLRKYSESMSNLSLLSPQSKFAIQGSMPNLNEIQKISSIDQNRYYQQQQPPPPPSQQAVKQFVNPSLDSSCSSETSAVSQPDVLFNHCEILAQSSRFNLHEVGRQTRQGSPVTERKQVNQAAIGYKRRCHELSFSDAPSNESLHRNETLAISPPKRQRFESSSTLTPANASARGKKAWSQTQPKKLKLAQTMSLMKKPATPSKKRDQTTVRLYNSDLYMQTYINPDPFAATTTIDPFLASTMYLDEQAVERHQADFIKWLNALVSIPADLDADSNNKIDIGKLFNEVRNKDLSLAPTKEEQSMNYLTSSRLESLRRAAVELFFSEEMRLPCSKVAVYVQKQALRIRSDRNLHLDMVMQRTILELLLCFNPLWLRLGLEVVFGEKLHLQSNRDIVGLTTFILNRLFRNKCEEQKYSKAYTLTEEYAETIKKNTLQKILFLLLFLDLAKQRRIIKHNPCLFVKKSPHKETKDILLRFSSELLANIGDITRELRRLGYVLKHKQTFLDEFNYAFSNLAVDLRDGVRLTRVMEVILLRDDLTQQLRVPAISRLQRIFNVKLALGALRDADFQLSGDISAADIVDGYREKTLSLLWQLCYKFRSPKFHAAARVVQAWWRRRWLRVVIKRRIRERAAIRIQTAFRSYQARKYAKSYREERVRAVIVLQKYTRRYLAQKHFAQMHHSIVLIQAWWRANRQARQCRQEFLQLRKSTIFLQRIWRRRLFCKKLLIAASAARRQLDQKRYAAASCIEMRWRSYRLAKEQRRIYVRQRELIILVQRTVRSKLLMRDARKRFQLLRSAALVFQRRYRARLQMLEARRCFLDKRRRIIVLQRCWRAKLEMRSQVAEYQRLKAATILIQRRYRNLLQMRQQRSAFVQMRSAAIVLQRCWRTRQSTRTQREQYQRLRRVTILMQRRFHANKAMRIQRARYRGTQAAVACLQMHWRNYLLGKSHRQAFVAQRQAAIRIQRWFRGCLAMRSARSNYRRHLTAATRIQVWWRSLQVMRTAKMQYQKLRSATISIQLKFRATRIMRQQRSEFVRLRQIAVHLQQKFRGKRLMLVQQAHLQLLKRSTLVFQSHARGFLARKRFQALMTPEMMEYLSQKRAAKVIQRYWRGYRTRKHQRHARLLAIRRRLLQLRQEATAFNSVRAKVQDSVRILRGRFVASDALAVLNQLDRLSRTVPHLLMWCSEFMSTFCYGIMAQAIRSEVDKQLIERCSRIILNLARYNSTTVNTFQEGGLVTVAQMLLRWCDKDSEIFNTLCTLIWVFAHCPKKRRIIHNFMSNTEAIYMVRETKKLVARKEKMKQNVRKSTAPVSGSGRHGQQMPNFSPRSLPSLEPDFGIIRGRPYTFISSVFAFDTILSKLQIELF
ncbi:hypothetical protein AWZ03_011162 [Drosophila navojoa]|uniref:Calponin-homology (CH) domain-containing protein n=2 Tax=Drosophila navojoa TaxID=7232 RepID=A0A484B174_DRONA|nr:hypothetical protein AWZ03_011162 [Drosophila navojoa]